MINKPYIYQVNKNQESNNKGKYTERAAEGSDIEKQGKPLLIKRQ